MMDQVIIFILLGGIYHARTVTIRVARMVATGYMAVAVLLSIVKLL